MKQRNPSTNHKCKVCDKTFESSRGLNIHKSKMHYDSTDTQQGGKDKEVKTKPGTPSLKRKACDTERHNESDLKRHRIDKHEPSSSVKNTEVSHNVPTSINLFEILQKQSIQSTLMEYGPREEQPTRQPCEGAGHGVSTIIERFEKLIKPAPKKPRTDVPQSEGIN